jgi:HEAT repeat protein
MRRSSEDLVRLLSGGDRRSIGRVGEVVSSAQKNPSIVGFLVALLEHREAVVRMRAADALEKIQRRAPERVEAFRDDLLTVAERADEQELRWHLAQMIPRFDLSRRECARAAAAFEKYFGDESAIVRVSALQAIVELAQRDASLVPVARRYLARAKSGSAAEKARARKLAVKFG